MDAQKDNCGKTGALAGRAVLSRGSPAGGDLSFFCLALCLVLALSSQASSRVPGKVQFWVVHYDAAKNYHILQPVHPVTFGVRGGHLTVGSLVNCEARYERIPLTNSLGERSLVAKSYLKCDGKEYVIVGVQFDTLEEARR